MVGSAKMLRETGEHPTVLREQVTSPGGTTAAAIRELEDHKVRAAFLSALESGPRPVARTGCRITPLRRVALLLAPQFPALFEG